MEPQIAPLVNRSLASFEKLSDLAASDQDEYSTTRSHLSRFKLWAGSLGAHRSSGGRSLEYRLRDSSFVRNHVVSLLQELVTLIDEGIRVADGDGGAEGAMNTGDEVDMDLDSYFQSDDANEQSDTNVILGDIGHVIDCLLRMSITIRNPAPHDQFNSKAGADTISFYREWDMNHISEKFTHLDSKIVTRLAIAMSRRRQYFKYREEHSKKLSQGLFGEIDQSDNTTTIASSIPSHLKDNENQASLNVMDELSDKMSLASATSYAPSNATSDELRVPKVPKEYINGPFQCPFCHAIIMIDDRSSWKRHVFGDLQAYTCLFDNCSVPGQLFRRRKDWAAHMRQEHWVSWTCSFGCSKSFSSQEGFKNHIVKDHGQNTHSLDLQAVMNLCSFPSDENAIGNCPLCSDFLITSSKSYQSHVGGHLERLALFALPNTLQDDSGDEEDDDDDDYDDEGRAAVTQPLGEMLSPPPEGSSYPSFEALHRAISSYSTSVGYTIVAEPYPTVPGQKMVLFACSRAGKPPNMSEVRKRRKPSRKCECPFSFFAVELPTKWTIRYRPEPVHLKHNHGPNERVRQIDENSSHSSDSHRNEAPEPIILDPPWGTDPQQERLETEVDDFKVEQERTKEEATQRELEEKVRKDAKETLAKKMKEMEALQQEVEEDIDSDPDNARRRSDAAKIVEDARRQLDARGTDPYGSQSELTRLLRVMKAEIRHLQGDIAHLNSESIEAEVAEEDIESNPGDARRRSEANNIVEEATRRVKDRGVDPKEEIAGLESQSQLTADEERRFVNEDWQRVSEDWQRRQDEERGLDEQTDRLRRNAADSIAEVEARMNANAEVDDRAAAERLRERVSPGSNRTHYSEEAGDLLRPNTDTRIPSGLSAYSFFAKEQHEAIRRSKLGRSSKYTDRLVEERWRALNREQRAPYEAEAAAARKRFESGKQASNADQENERKNYYPDAAVEMHNLNRIANDFYSNWKPRCREYIEAPPGDLKQREDMHRRLSESIMQQVLLKLEHIEAGGVAEIRQKRKELVREVQDLLKQLDTAMKG